LGVPTGLRSSPQGQNDSAVQWLQNNVPEFITAAEWPSGSPDLNLLDYKLWNYLEEKACCIPHSNLESLKVDLVKAAASIPLDVVRAAIDEWPGRLKKCVAEKGGHIE